MALIDEVKIICDRLAMDAGWHDLLLQHGLDIKACPLEAELKKQLPVDRTVNGFEDFSLKGNCAIEAGNPSRSLLYHAFASPNVTTDSKGNALTIYPTAAEIETVLNYVYGVCPPGLEALFEQAGEGAVLAIVVFAIEYRPGPGTVHGKHADLCFSRTGIARVGTAPAWYDPQRRGFLPWVEDDPKAIRVMPARFSAYIAVQRKGDAARFGPQSFQPGDEERDFWTPLHKLFEGTECIAGMELNVNLECYHINDKLRRFHLKFPEPDWQEPVLSGPPFVLTDGLAHWADETGSGQGLLLPVAQRGLVEKATYDHQDVFFTIPAEPNYRGYIINRRYKLLEDGSIDDLNLNPDVVNIVKAGGYRALHFIDFTAEGWVRASCPTLETVIPDNAVAYSIIAAPDFYPASSQRELLEWSDQQQFPQPFFGQSLRVLSNLRAAGNPDLNGNYFQPDDKGITAIVSHPVEVEDRAASGARTTNGRPSWLSDRAAGSLSPGWEISGPDGGGPRPASLCGYELGSPFTEDVRICASIGGYWPAVSPDTSRTFEPNASRVPIIPLTDEEGGQADSGSWDGVDGPRLLTDAQGKQVVEYTAFDHCDYTKNALAGLLSLHRTAQTSADDYARRIWTLHNAFTALGASTRQQKAEWSVLSFRKITRPHAALEFAEQEAGAVLQGDIHCYQIYKPDKGSLSTPPGDFTKRQVEILEMTCSFVGEEALLSKRGDAAWTVQYLG